MNVAEEVIYLESDIIISGKFVNYLPELSLMVLNQNIFDGLYLIVNEQKIQLYAEGIILREMIFALDTRMIKCYFEKENIAISPEEYNNIAITCAVLRKEKENPPLQPWSVRAGVLLRNMTIITARSNIGKSQIAIAGNMLCR